MYSPFQICFLFYSFHQTLLFFFFFFFNDTATTEIYTLSLHDALPIYFIVRIEEESRRHLRFAEPVSLVLLDLDRFKDVNDRFGHRAGDEALREVAQVLLKRSEEHTSELQSRSDLVCRLLLEKKKKKKIRTTQARRKTQAARQRDTRSAQEGTVGNIRSDVTSLAARTVPGRHTQVMTRRPLSRYVILMLSCILLRRASSLTLRVRVVIHPSSSHFRFSCLFLFLFFFFFSSFIVLFCFLFFFF